MKERFYWWLSFQNMLPLWTYYWWWSKHTVMCEQDWDYKP